MIHDFEALQGFLPGRRTSIIEKNCRSRLEEHQPSEGSHWHCFSKLLANPCEEGVEAVMLSSPPLLLGHRDS